MDHKPLSHLDPKMQEKYARIMGHGTAAAGDQTAQELSPPPTAEVPDTAGGQPLGNTDPLNEPTGVQQAQTFSPSVSPLPEAAAAPEAPTESPFFSNAETPQAEAAQAYAPEVNQPTEQAANPAPESTNSFTPGAPITPYAANTASANLGGAAATSPFSKPLPSPADLAQNGPRETSALLKVLYIVGAVVFFMIYTIFWIKVFNLPFIF